MNFILPSTKHPPLDPIPLKCELEIIIPVSLVQVPSWCVTTPSLTFRLVG